MADQRSSGAIRPSVLLRSNFIMFLCFGFRLGLAVYVGTLAIITPLAPAVKFAERETLSTFAAFALYFRQPRVSTGCKTGDVGGNEFT